MDLVIVLTAVVSLEDIAVDVDAATTFLLSIVGNLQYERYLNVECLFFVLFLRYKPDLSKDPNLFEFFH